LSNCHITDSIIASIGCIAGTNFFKPLGTKSRDKGMQDWQAQKIANAVYLQDKCNLSNFEKIKTATTRRKY
jgi:hypothetical protein